MTTNINLTAGTMLFLATEVDDYTVTLPASPSNGAVAEIVWDENATAVVILCNGNNVRLYNDTIEATSFTMQRQGEYLRMVYITSLSYWRVIEDPPENIVTTTVDYTVLEGDYSIEVDATSAAITITMLSAANGREVKITKIDSTTNDVDITADGSETISGLSTATINNQWDSLNLTSNGTNWTIS